MDEVRRQVHRERLDKVVGNLDLIEARLQMLTELRSMDRQLQNKTDDKARVARAKIKECRVYVEQKNDVKTKELLEQVRTILADLNSELTEKNAPDTQIASSAAKAVTLDEAFASAMKAQKAQTHPTKKQRGKAWLVELAGLSEEVRAEATMWLLRPLLYLVLLILLIILGLTSLYVDR